MAGQIDPIARMAQQLSRLPGIGALYAPNQGLFPAYAAGLYNIPPTRLIISRGLGNSIIPVRIGNRPELVSITLQPTP